MSYLIVKTGVGVSLVVGTVLNLINQWAAIWGTDTLVVWQLILNYLVPFTVSVYSGWQQEHRMKTTKVS
ncbi:MAG: hypothetical protein HLUCCO02_05190 [Idiomarinaceae bacterium HL-53]|nr:MAG: hypothetical protein HLUCCO02_05190 [Idiomarinaceae bacterium HL-53]CUS47954.1 hypothetical protein Ga0003345_0893 [Idiomarinaceae bacterium HL-53]